MSLTFHQLTDFEVLRYHPYYAPNLHHFFSLVEARIQVFPRLLKLSGRLELMLSQVHFPFVRTTVEPLKRYSLLIEYQCSLHAILSLYCGNMCYLNGISTVVDLSVTPS